MITRRVVIVISMLATLLSAASARGKNMMLHKAEVKVDRGMSESFVAHAGIDWENCYLKLDARIESARRIGSTYALHVSFNGVNLDSRRLVNYPDPLYFHTAGGRALFLYSKPHEMYRTVYSPDFEKFPVRNQTHNPAFAAEYPYSLVFDVTDLVRADGENTVLIRNKIRHLELPIYCRNIELLADYRKMPGYPGTDAARIPGFVVPRTDFKVDYKLTTDKNGGMRLAVNGETYDISGIFSYHGVPDGNWNSFAACPGNSEWNVTILQNAPGRVVIQGLGKYYSVARTIDQLPDRIAISDKITNQTSDYLGVMYKQLVNATGIKKLRQAGYIVPSLSGTLGEQVRCGENPTIYVQQNNSGVGIFAVDDVSRANASMESEKDGSHAIQNRRLVIAPGKSYTAEFEIYPTATADYFAFVNAARRVLGVNFTIDANLTYAHGFNNQTTQIPQSEFRDFIRFNNPGYIGIHSAIKINDDGTRTARNELSSFTWGSLTLLDDSNKYTREMIVEVKNRFLRENPELKFVVYHNCFLWAESNPENFYSDSSLWYGSSNELVKYTRLKGARMAPRVDNGWGRDLQKVYEFFRDNGLGIFWDEATAEPYFAYNDWDGYTGIIDPKTFRLQRKIRNVALDSLEFRLALLDFCEKNNMPVWCNFMPVTSSMTKRKVYRFVEGHDPLSANRTHFYTPISWGTPHTEISEEDITDSMKNKLVNGGLYMYYSTKFTSDNNFMQKLYPFTPTELHRGYIIGQEKILTMRGGNFGWGDQSAIKAEVFGRTGHLTDKTVPVRSDHKYGNYADIDLEQGEFALIYRK